MMLTRRWSNELRTHAQANSDEDSDEDKVDARNSSQCAGHLLIGGTRLGDADMLDEEQFFMEMEAGTQVRDSAGRMPRTISRK
jgi:hypothetical protein